MKREKLKPGDKVKVYCELTRKTNGGCVIVQFERGDLYSYEKNGLVRMTNRSNITKEGEDAINI